MEQTGIFSYDKLTNSRLSGKMNWWSAKVENRMQPNLVMDMREPAIGVVALPLQKLAAKCNFATVVDVLALVLFLAIAYTANNTTPRAIKRQQEGERRAREGSHRSGCKTSNTLFAL